MKSTEHTRARARVASACACVRAMLPERDEKESRKLKEREVERR